MFIIHRHRPQALFFVSCLLLLPVPAPAVHPYETLRGQCMGTTYTIKIADRPESITLDAIAGAVRSELDRIEQIFSLYRSQSELSQFNANPTREWMDVSHDLYSVAGQALKLAERTGGAFDPTIGPCVRLWRPGVMAVDWSPPSAEKIAEVRRHVGYSLIETRSRPTALRKLASSVELDLNALVEGWAIDRLVDLLARNGIHGALIELGGEFRGVGRRADGEAWHVGIENPRIDQTCYATVILRDAALATSGDYRQSITHHGERYSHILDARTGRPIDHDLTAVSVMADDAFTADGWATALLILGPDEGRRVAEQEGIAASFVRRSPTVSASLSSAATDRIAIVPSGTGTGKQFSSGLFLGVLTTALAILAACGRLKSLIRRKCCWQSGSASPQKATVDS